MKKKFLFGFAIILIVAQFIQPTKNTGKVYGANDFTQTIDVPENVKNILNKACMNCHSNNTIYPWYTKPQPFGWWIQHHVNEGKRELNFSEFKNYKPQKQAHKMEEIAEMVADKTMPLNSYTWMHKGAKLNSEEIKLLIDWSLKCNETIIIKNNLSAEEEYKH